MTILPATQQDAHGIATVQVTSWQAAYGSLLDPEFLASLSIEKRAARWEEILRQRESETMVARSAADVAGFVSFGRCRDDGEDPRKGEIWSLYVAPECWSTGMGRALLDAAVRALHAQGRDSVSVWVLAGNDRALRFYQRCGFTTVPGMAKTCSLGGRDVEEVCLQLEPDA